MAASATGQHERLGEEDAVVFERRFRAPIDDVWAAITESDRLGRWIGTWSGDPASGSVQFLMTAEGEGVAESTYQIEACDPPHRLDLRSVDESGTWVLRLSLEETQGFTTLRFAQLLPDLAVLDDTGPGWDYYLDRLVAVETEGDVEAIDFERDYHPALVGHYRAIRERLEAERGDRDSAAPDTQ